MKKQQRIAKKGILQIGVGFPTGRPPAPKRFPSKRPRPRGAERETRGGDEAGQKWRLRNLYKKNERGDRPYLPLLFLFVSVLCGMIGFCFSVAPASGRESGLFPQIGRGFPTPRGSRVFTSRTGRRGGPCRGGGEEAEGRRPRGGRGREAEGRNILGEWDNGEWEWQRERRGRGREGGGKGRGGEGKGGGRFGGEWEGEGKEEEDSDRFGIGDGRAGEWESFRRDRWWEYTQIRQFVSSHSLLSLCFVAIDRE